MKTSKLKRTFVLFSCTLISIVTFAESDLSRAEQAAIEAAQATEQDDAQKRIDLCNHVLLYGMADQKEALLAELGDFTCEEAISQTGGSQ